MSLEGVEGVYPGVNCDAFEDFVRTTMLPSLMLLNESPSVFIFPLATYRENSRHDILHPRQRSYILYTTGSSHLVMQII